MVLSADWTKCAAVSTFPSFEISTPEPNPFKLTSPCCLASDNFGGFANGVGRKFGTRISFRRGRGYNLKLIALCLDTVRTFKAENSAQLFIEESEDKSRLHEFKACVKFELIMERCYKQIANWCETLLSER